MSETGMQVTSNAALLAPDTVARLVEFARAFRAAARAVSFYPTRHPAVVSALGQLVDLARRATASGALTLNALPGALLVSGLAPSKADAATTELAFILHRHSIGVFTLHGASDVASWRTLLELLARSPEEVRADGGIKRLWAGAGASSLEIQEIDYAQLLRGRIGGDASDMSGVIHHYLADSSALSLEDAALQTLMGIVQSMKGGESEDGTEAQLSNLSRQQASAILRVLRGLCDVTTTTQPERFDTVFRKAALVGAQLSIDVMEELIAARGTPEAMVESVDVVSALLDRMDNPSVARFMANTIVAEHGASQRLAEAFSCMVQDQERRRDVLSLAQEQIADSPLIVEDGFLASWEAVEEALESYSDRAFVSEEYSKELYAARSRAVEIEQLTEDPPARIAGWLGTIEDAELQELDLQLLLDLLAIETDPFRWHEVLDTTVVQMEALARVGHLQAATRLIQAIALEASEDGRVFHRPFALEALERTIASPLVRHRILDLRRADEADAAIVRQFLHALGPGVVRTLAEQWSTDEDPRLRKQIQQLVTGFTERGRAAVQKLMTAPDCELRRAAVFLLRGFGTCDVATFGPLLADADPRVRHEAFHTLAFSGDSDAHGLLWRTFISAEQELRKALTTELLATRRDERAAPLFCSLVRELEPRDAPKALYVAAIEALGRFGGPDAVQALQTALYRGSWLSPFKTRSYRTAAAAALARIGSSAAMHVLREASTRGALDVRVISRAHLKGAS